MGVILTPEELIAEYVIQVSTVFKPGTSNILGSFNLWKKGGHFGKGDELLKFCPANGCKGFFDDTFSLTEQEAERCGNTDVNSWPASLRYKYEHWYQLPVMCSTCGTICTREALPDSYGFNMDSGKIAKRLHDFFTLLSGSADVLSLIHI